MESSSSQPEQEEELELDVYPGNYHDLLQFTKELVEANTTLNNDFQYFIDSIKQLEADNASLFKKNQILQAQLEAETYIGNDTIVGLQKRVDQCESERDFLRSRIDALQEMLVSTSHTPLATLSSENSQLKLRIMELERIIMMLTGVYPPS